MPVPIALILIGAILAAQLAIAPRFLFLVLAVCCFYWAFDRFDQWVALKVYKRRSK